MTCDLRRLRLRGLMERVPSRTATASPKTGCAPRCATTAPTGASNPALAAVADRSPPELGRLVDRFDRHVERLWEGRRMAA